MLLRTRLQDRHPDGCCRRGRLGGGLSRARGVRSTSDRGEQRSAQAHSGRHVVGRHSGGVNRQHVEGSLLRKVGCVNLVHSQQPTLTVPAQQRIMHCSYCTPSCPTFALSAVLSPTWTCASTSTPPAPNPPTLKANTKPPRTHLSHECVVCWAVSRLDMCLNQPVQPPLDQG